VTNIIKKANAEPRALLDPKAASQYIGVSKSFLDKRRVGGNGPPYRKVGRRVFYWRNELEAWVDQCPRSSTSEVGEA
jgi:predicted DNA-binding transcriptional regulator AlpA